MKKNKYFCNCCRKEIKNLSSLLFVDDFSMRGFCSEKCILEFHAPYIDSFYDQEAVLRESLKVIDLNELPAETESYLFQELISKPDEIWKDSNDLGEIFYTYISFHEQLNIYVIMICFQYEGEVSFIFHKCTTASVVLVEQFRTSERVITSKIGNREIEEEVQIEQDIELPVHVMEELELKKSIYLANLLENRAEDDIEYDEFMDYEQYLPLTLEDPDEVYETIDSDADEVSTFIKSFQYHRGTFFYVVVCWKCSIKSVEEQVLIPILSFPSTDHSLYQEFAIGERVVGQLKN